MLRTVTQHWKKILVGATLLGTTGVVVADVALQPDPIVVDKPEVLNWTAPSNDAGWAEESKLETIDGRSDAVLQQMKQSLVDDLANLEKPNIYTECPECKKYEYRKELEAEGVTEPELSTRVQEAFDTNYGALVYTIERSRQAIERINNEVRLRKNGYVVRTIIDK